MRPVYICLYALILVFSSCSKTDPNTSAGQIQPVYPVLKFKEFNNVLQVCITVNDTLKSCTLKGFTINISGTTDPDDIESVTLFYNGNFPGDLREDMVKFSLSEKIAPVIKLKGSMKLVNRKNYFWVSYKLKDTANPLNMTGCICEKVITDAGESIMEAYEGNRPMRIGVALRKHNDDSVHTYRIPGLVTTTKGTLLAVYDARRQSSRDLQGDIDIGISRSTDGGNSWDPMTIALDMGEWGGLPQKFNGVSDASLLVDDKSGNIFVAGLWMYGVLDDKGKWIDNLNPDSKEWNHQWRNRGSQPGFDPKETSQFLVSRSTDDGRTWEEPVNFTSMCKKKEWWLWAPAPGNGITMNDGTLVFPTQGRDNEGTPFSNITFSRDGGITWETSNPAFTNTTECAVVQLDDGALMLNMRNNRNRNNDGPDNGRAVSVSRDLGKTWIEHPTSSSVLNEPVCMASLFRYEFEEDGISKSVLFFSNPDTRRGRHHITIKASFDNGITWPEGSRLLLDEGTGNGYSCLTKVDEESIGILYEGSQANLVFQKIPLSEFIK